MRVSAVRVAAFKVGIGEFNLRFQAASSFPALPLAVQTPRVGKVQAVKEASGCYCPEGLRV